MVLSREHEGTPSSKGVIGSSELHRGKAGCSSLRRTEVLLHCQAGEEEGRGQSPVFRRNSCTAQISSSSVPLCPAFPLQQIEITGLLKLSGSAVKGWMMPRPLTDISCLTYHLRNMPHSCHAESSIDLLLFLLIYTLLQATSQQVVTTALSPSSPPW